MSAGYRRRSAGAWAWTVARGLLLGVMTVCTLSPVVWMVLTSVKPPADYFSNPPVWLPAEPTLGHYADLFGTFGAWSYLWNSVLVGVACTVLTLAVAIPAAYVLGTGRNRREARASFFVLAQRTLPPIVLLVPTYLVFARLGLIDTRAGLVLAFSAFNVPFAVWLLRGFFADFPREVQEQSFVDGLSEFASLYRIVLPMVAPGVVVVALFSFLASWNELMLAITLTGDQAGTMTKLLASLLQAPTGTQFGPAAGAAVISMTPALLLTLMGQRYLVRGLTGGSVK